MDTIKQNKPTGSLKISEEVLATIAKVAALEIQGVDSLAEPAGTMRRILGRSIGRQPVHIALSDDFAEINISLNLRFGAKIGEVCPAVQQNIKDNIQTMTGMAVSKVNVAVTGIVFEESAPQAQQ